MFEKYECNDLFKGSFHHLWNCKCALFQNILQIFHINNVLSHWKLFFINWLLNFKLPFATSDPSPLKVTFPCWFAINIQFPSSAHVIVAISSDIVLRSVSVYFISIPLGGVLIKFPSLLIDARRESMELTFLDTLIPIQISVNLKVHVIFAGPLPMKVDVFVQFMSEKQLIFNLIKISFKNQPQKQLERCTKDGLV